MSQASKGIGYTSWLVLLSCILNLETVWTDSRTTRLYYTWIYIPLWQGIFTCSFAERKNMRQWAQTLTIKGFTRYSFAIRFQLLSGRPASPQERSVQGPVARSLVNANRWLRGIKMYRFPWYLTLVSTNHASSNPGQESCSVHIRTCARAYIYSWNIEKYIYIFLFSEKAFFFYYLIGMNDIFFAIQCLCVSISFNFFLFHNFVGVTCLNFFFPVNTVQLPTILGMGIINH